MLDRSWEFVGLAIGVGGHDGYGPRFGYWRSLYKVLDNPQMFNSHFLKEHPAASVRQ